MTLMIASDTCRLRTAAGDPQSIPDSRFSSFRRIWQNDVRNHRQPADTSGDPSATAAAECSGGTESI